MWLFALIIPTQTKQSRSNPWGNRGNPTTKLPATRWWRNAQTLLLIDLISLLSSERTVECYPPGSSLGARPLDMRSGERGKYSYVDSCWEWDAHGRNRIGRSSGKIRPKLLRNGVWEETRQQKLADIIHHGAVGMEFTSRLYTHYGI